MSDTAPSHRLNLRKPYLKLIADDIKTVEVRVGYAKIRKIQAGHELTFVSGDDTIVTRVKRVTEYDNFEALLDHEDAVAIGGDLGESRDELLAVIRGYTHRKKKSSAWLLYRLSGYDRPASRHCLPLPQMLQALSPLMGR